MTSPQLKVVEMPMDKNILVSGTAGSGKTLVLLQRAFHLQKKYCIPSQRYRMFVLNDMARDYIKKEAKNLGLPEEAVVAFNQWCREFYETHISEDLPRTYVNLRVDFTRIKEGVKKLLKSKPQLHHSLSFALVDDGQDLEPQSYEILSLVSSHVTVFADFQQKMTPHKTSETLILENLSSCQKLLLPQVYKNSLFVARLASYFIEDKDLRRKYLDQLCGPSQEEDLPLCYVVPSFEEDMHLLAETVRMRQSRGERIGILVPREQMVYKFVRELKKRGVNVEKAIEKDAQNVLHEPYDFENDLPKITTFDRARGLTFDSLFIPQIREEYFACMDHESRMRTLFTAVVRARKWVYLSIVKGKEIEEIAVLKKAQKNGDLLML